VLENIISAVVIQITLKYMQVMRFSQWCGWGFCSCGVWYCITSQL